MCHFFFLQGDTSQHLTSLFFLGMQRTVLFVSGCLKSSLVQWLRNRTLNPGHRGSSGSGLSDSFFFFFASWFLRFYWVGLLFFGSFFLFLTKIEEHLAETEQEEEEDIITFSSWLFLIECLLSRNKAQLRSYSRVDCWLSFLDISGCAQMKSEWLSWLLF